MNHNLPLNEANLSLILKTISEAHKDFVSKDKQQWFDVLHPLFTDKAVWEQNGEEISAFFLNSYLDLSKITDPDPKPLLDIFTQSHHKEQYVMVAINMFTSRALKKEPLSCENLKTWMTSIETLINESKEKQLKRDAIAAYLSTATISINLLKEGGEDSFPQATSLHLFVADQYKTHNLGDAEEAFKSTKISTNKSWFDLYGGWEGIIKNQSIFTDDWLAQKYIKDESFIAAMGLEEHQKVITRIVNSLTIKNFNLAILPLFSKDPLGAQKTQQWLDIGKPLDVINSNNISTLLCAIAKHKPEDLSHYKQHIIVRENQCQNWALPLLSLFFRDKYKATVIDESSPTALIKLLAELNVPIPSSVFTTLFIAGKTDTILELHKEGLFKPKEWQGTNENNIWHLLFTKSPNTEMDRFLSSGETRKLPFINSHMNPRPRNEKEINQIIQICLNEAADLLETPNKNKELPIAKLQASYFQKQNSFIFNPPLDVKTQLVKSIEHPDRTAFILKNGKTTTQHQHLQQILKSSQELFAEIEKSWLSKHHPTPEKAIRKAL